MQAAARKFSIGGIPPKFEWCTELLDAMFSPEHTVLDVAAGSGGLALLVADNVKSVTCLDCEESSIEEAKKACSGAENICFKKVLWRCWRPRPRSLQRAHHVACALVVLLHSYVT